MGKRLKDLNEFNTERRELYEDLNTDKPQPNGIACPECGEELYDERGNFILGSNPPMKRVHCTNCGYVGHRIA